MRIGRSRRAVKESALEARVRGSGRCVCGGAGVGKEEGSVAPQLEKMRRRRGQRRTPLSPAATEGKKESVVAKYAGRRQSGAKGQGQEERQAISPVRTAPTERPSRRQIKDGFPSSPC